MGVTGLWRLIEPAGKPVPVETLENKVLAVDISIWLHQMVKGYQDAKGAPLANAHLMGLFQRLCKLLYFRIKPVFVFDGAFPDLKKETIAKRQDNKSKYNSESERLKRELALLLSKKTAIRSLLGKQISPKKGTSSTGPTDSDDIFKLPALPQNKEESESESEDEDSSSSSIIDLHSVDIESSNFKNLPIKEKYDLLLELKETRKMNSWGKLHELPKKSDNFSDFQMQRLLKRRKIQECLQETEQEMGDSGMSLNELESLLNEEGIDTKIDNIPSRRIASNDTTRFVLINNVKQALADAKNNKKSETEKETNNIEEKNLDEENKTSSKRDELEEDLQKAIKMSLECVNEADTSACTSKTDDSWTSCMTEPDYSNTDSEEEDGFDEPDMSSAKAYIMQYSDFTHRAIENIVASKNKSSKNKSKVPKVDEILEEINRDKSVVIDKVDLYSSDEDYIHEKMEADKNLNIAKSHGGVKLNTTTDIGSQVENLDTTQLSVVCIDNPIQEIVTLDSSTELSPNKSTTVLSDAASKDISDSSDNEFDDVPELEDKSNKTVVQLTLDMNTVAEDDMFADVFEGIDKQENITKIEDKIVNLKTITKSDIEDIKSTNDSEEDDLQKAIMMSLECVNECTKTFLFNDAIDVSRQDPKSKENITKNIEKPDKDSPNKQEKKATKTIESGQESQSTQETNINNDYNGSEIENNGKTVSKPNENPPKEPISVEKLNTMVEEIQNEEEDLLQEKGRMDRVGRNITQQMTKEAQELLQIFGIPYIVAPMEAEAQCAFLESVNLTDGTITDDSDIWLFGGKTVYKNFFNQKKHVLQFLAERIEKSFNLNREQLILLALLVGSDYTTGVTGVGPVTALEILASFPFNKRFHSQTAKDRNGQIVTGLQEFKQWIRAGRRTDNIGLKKKLRNVNLTDDFPSARVVHAYLEPNIEKSEDKFTWGELDLTVLRDYTKAKFGWSQHKLDEIIKPVLNRLVERKSQRSVQDYFKRKIDFQDLQDQMSKRVKAAVRRMGSGDGLPLDEGIAPIEEHTLKPPRKRKANKNQINISHTVAKAGPSGAKQRNQTEEYVLMEQGVKVLTQVEEGAPSIEIKIQKSDRFQETIPQRERDKQSLLQNKLKAIELFRKTKIDRKKKTTKKKVKQPKDKVELSESSDSN